MGPILVLNAGSSTLKCAVFQDGRCARRQTFEIAGDFPAAVAAALEHLADTRFEAVGHRVVHGGPKFTEPVRIDPATLAEFETLIPLAPLHMPAAIDGIRSLAAIRPDIPQVACFDTAFHATMPAIETRFGLPRRFHDRGIRRYGFHGLSYESIAAQLPAVSPRAAAGRTIVCHLGNGASLCGFRAGKSQTTTMGFSPLDGLLMATRPGRLDPGAILYLLKSGMTLDAVEHLLEHESGLLGVSGLSSDLRVLQASSAPEAHEAIQLFCRIMAREAAAATAVLGGIDALVFTGGIGENAPAIRQTVCDQLNYLGLGLDSDKNIRSEVHLHNEASSVEILRLATDEASVVALHTARLLGVAT